MKIGFFTDWYLPQSFGVETSIESFRKNLEKMGHKVFVYAPYFPGYKDHNPHIFRFKTKQIIKEPKVYFTLPFIPLNNFRKTIRLKLDIVHSHTPFSMGLLGKFIAFYQKIPLIYTHHTQYPEYTKIYLKEKIILPRLAKISITKYSNISNAIIAPSFKIKKQLRNYKVKKPIYVLPTGVNLKIFKKSEKNKQELRKKLKISPKTKILLFVGRMGKEKNPEFLLKMFKKILKQRKDLILLMVGDGYYLKKLKEIAQNLKIEKNIKFTGSIPHSKISTYYQVADIFVFSSLSETQGIVILEAMACGLPVVALKDNVFQDIIINNKNGFLIKEFSTKIFAEKILKILDDSLCYQNFSAMSLKIAENFSEKNQTEKLLNIYEKLIISKLKKSCNR